MVNHDFIFSFEFDSPIKALLNPEAGQPWVMISGQIFSLLSCA
jgi:hypothetical protein